MSLPGPGEPRSRRLPPPISRFSSSCRSSCSSAPGCWFGPSPYPKCSVSSAANPRSKASLSNAGNKPWLPVISISPASRRSNNASNAPRVAKLLHRLTPTSASRDNIIIIHHASILSNKMTDTQTIEHAHSRRSSGTRSNSRATPNSPNCSGPVRTELSGGPRPCGRGPTSLRAGMRVMLVCSQPNQRRT